MRVSTGRVDGFGDETISWRLDGSLGLAAFQGDLVLIRRGGAVSTFLHLAAGAGRVSVDGALTDQLARAADRRLAAGLGQPVE